jgi:hypothetical protein
MMDDADGVRLGGRHRVTPRNALVRDAR